jgi:hypothetical protein
MIGPWDLSDGLDDIDDVTRAAADLDDWVLKNLRVAWKQAGVVAELKKI